MSRSSKKGPFVNPKLLAKVQKMNPEDKKIMLRMGFS